MTVIKVTATKVPSEKEIPHENLNFNFKVIFQGNAKYFK